MKTWSVLPLLAILFTLSGCGIVEGIFEVGMWTGIIVVVLVVGVVLWLLSKLFGGRR